MDSSNTLGLLISNRLNRFPSEITAGPWTQSQHTSHKAPCVTQRPILTEELKRGALNVPIQRSACKSAMESGRSLMQGETTFPPGGAAGSASVPQKHLTGRNSYTLTPQILPEEIVLNKPTFKNFAYLFYYLDLRNVFLFPRNITSHFLFLELCCCTKTKILHQILSSLGKIHIYTEEYSLD